MFRYLLCIVLILSFLSSSSTIVYGNITARIKDIAYVQGVRDNFLFGYGLVVGLQGTGDKTTFTFTRQLPQNVF